VSSETEELYSLLIPLSEDRLIVPRACVAEVVRFTAPEHEPVASFEGALGKDVPVTTGRTRIVVFNATTGQLKTGYFGVLTQGFPQLVRVNEDVLQLHTTEGWPKDAPVLCRVKMINEFPLIPDLEKLEAMLPLIPDLEKLEAMLARESMQA
jgi:chemosensory pili system protein ChpC